MTGPEAFHEALALEHLAGRGVPRVLARDGQLGLRLETVEPGGAVDPAPGTAMAVAELLRLLHVPPPDGLPALGDVVLARLARAVAEGRASPRKAVWAERTVAALEADAPTGVLLHGAFDHRSLRTCVRQGLVAVGFTPCVGDPAYDAGSWVHAARAPGRRARLDAIVDATGLPRDRVRDWAAVVGVHG